MDSQYKADDAVTLYLHRQGGELQSPHAMIEYLKQRGHTEEHVRAAIWRLIDRGDAQLTMYRTLVLTGDQP